jgi:hypothetical protein
MHERQQRAEAEVDNLFEAMLEQAAAEQGMPESQTSRRRKAKRTRHRNEGADGGSGGAVICLIIGGAVFVLAIIFATREA